MTMIFKSETTPLSISEDAVFNNYKRRVESYGGHIIDEAETRGAIDFILSNNIALDKVAIAASPNWGVLTTPTGDVVKMFSLFDADGDLDMFINETDTTIIIDSEHGKAIRFLGRRYITDKSVIKSTGKFDVNEGSVIACVCKPFDSLSGITAGVGIYSFLSERPDGLDRYVDAQYISSSQDVSTWGFLTKSHGTRGKTQLDVSITKPNEWWTGVEYVFSLGHKLYRNGGVIGEDTSGNDPAYHKKTDLQAYFGNLYTDTGSIVNMARADFAEFWFLLDTGEPEAISLSVHLADKYT